MEESAQKALDAAVQIASMKLANGRDVSVESVLSDAREIQNFLKGDRIK